MSLHFILYANYYLTVNNALEFDNCQNKLVQPKS